VVVVSAGLGVLAAADAYGATVTEYPIPTPQSLPNGIVAGPDGALWFAEQLGGKIGRITTSGAITEYRVPTSPSEPISSPSQITAGPDGALWFTDGDVVWRIATSGAFTLYRVGVVSPYGIAAGPDGALWFTETFAPRIGRLTTSGVLAEYAVATAGSNDLLGITAGPDKALWFTERASDKVGRVTTSGVVSEYPVPGPGSGPTLITAGPDGALWFTEEFANKIVRVTTSGAFTVYEVPTPNSEPSGITVGPDGALWFTESFANKIGRITTSGRITEYPVPGADGPLGIDTGSDGALWFTDEGGDKIGRLAVSHRTDTRVSCSPRRFAPWDATVCTATVSDTASGAQSTPTGRVTFSSSGRGTFGGSPCTLSGSGASASCSVFFTSFARGSQTIAASYGGDDSHDPSTGDTSVTVAVPPGTDGCAVFGHGRITAADGDRASFSGIALAQPPAGTEFYRDHGPTIRFRLRSLSVDAVTCSADATSAKVFGKGTVGGRASVDYRVDIRRARSSHSKGSYRVRLTNGYDSGSQAVRNGSVNIRLRGSRRP
jgi:streptogramin lyase